LIDSIRQNKSGGARFSKRKSSLALILFACGTLAIGLIFVHAGIQRRADAPAIAHMADVVRTLELTDLCLFTEARYTRHPSQADMHSAFQDHPAALEHFPTGSIAGPPANLRRINEKLD